MTFDDLRLSEPILRAVKDSGYTQPTPIQREAIPPILKGEDLLGCAQTGTGKTAAFALPILERLYQAARQHSEGWRPPGARALVLSPTRELAAQIYESFCEYGKYTSVRSTVIYGGVRQSVQTTAMKGGVDVLVATPGRLLDLMGQRLARVTLVETVVLDEADRLLDMGFLPDIQRILAHIPEDRQALMFSATMPPAIRKLAKEVLRNPTFVQTDRVSSAATTVEHWVRFVQPERKPELLAQVLRELAGTRTLVFTRTKHGADKVARHLSRAGIRAMALHGDKLQSDRDRAMAAFRSERPPVLVATDIAARGLDVDDIAHVINYDMASQPETYVHRIGRAGRAGATGKAISFCTPREKNELRAIERLIREPLRPVDGGDASVAEETAADSGRGAARPRGARGGRGRGAAGSSRNSRRRRGRGRGAAAAAAAG